MNKAKFVFLLVAMDLVLSLLFWYYQPLCEPCLDKQDCPACMSKEQYFLIYLGVAINLSFAVYFFIKTRSQN